MVKYHCEDIPTNEWAQPSSCREGLVRLHIVSAVGATYVYLL